MIIYFLHLLSSKALLFTCFYRTSKKNSKIFYGDKTNPESKTSRRIYGHFCINDEDDFILCCRLCDSEFDTLDEMSNYVLSHKELNDWDENCMDTPGSSVVFKFEEKIDESLYLQYVDDKLASYFNTSIPICFGMSGCRNGVVAVSHGFK